MSYSPAFDPPFTLMKTSALPPKNRRRRAFALVLVISMIALMTMLVVATLSLARDGSKEAVLDMGRMRAEMTAQNALNVALAQLRDATSGEFVDGTPMPWTSQPGAIRAHNRDGSLNRLFKLYTAEMMQAASLEGVEADVPEDWAQRLDQFVDLNEPFLLTTGEKRFPVIDPRAWSQDPLLAVEGFQYDAVKGAVGPSAAGDAAQRLPMPVRWLYQLQDGTLGTLDAGGRFQGANGARATKDNPMVGRFAFWVDDETSKVNINTAAEGAFWDTPRADTKQERALAATVPSRLEYMRHAGHPAGVCLSSVLLPQRRLTPMGFALENPMMRPMEAEDVRDLWRLGRLTVAEMEAGTSLGGTLEADWKALWPLEPQESVRQPRYASVGELNFDHVNAARFPSFWDDSSAPPAGERRRSRFFQRHPEIRERLAQRRFFLTAHSSGPETTLFGTPRVALWPVHAQTLLNGTSLGDRETGRDTVFNHKAAMAAMVKGQPYFIQRSEPGNGGNDFQVHAAGANRRLYEYLQRLTDRPFPGFDRPTNGGEATFAMKYEEDRDAILLSMMDYLRSANCAEPQLDAKMQFSVLCPGVEHNGFGQVSPLQQRVPGNQAARSNHAQGMGRMLTISEVALVVTCRAMRDEQGVLRGQPSSTAVREQLVNPGDRELEVALLVETFLPSQGWADYRPYATAALFGGQAGELTVGAWPEMRLNDQVLAPRMVPNRPKDPPMIHSGEGHSHDVRAPSGWNGAGGQMGTRALKHGSFLFNPIVVKADERGEVPPLKFEGGSAGAAQLKVALYDSPQSTSSADQVQVVPLVLPDITTTVGITLPMVENGVEPTLERRWPESARSGGRLFAATDVVQSLAPMHGDYRLTAMQRWVESRKGGQAGAPVFSPHPKWGLERQAHYLRDSVLPVELSQTQGYVHDVAYAAPFRPDMPATLADESARISVWQSGDWKQYSLSGALDALRLDNGRRGPSVPEFTGDFDNGMANQPDGPFSNRPDDGHWAALREGRTAYFDNVSQTGSTVPPVTLTAFAPQRLLPSPVMFGSLPTGSRMHVPWQTLLFRPHPQHYGAQVLPDHLLLDLFWMPVLEPEPLSTNLATEGKINLNHEILPFRHIRRGTALHAAMKAETLTAIPDGAAATYKSGEAPDDKFRRYIDAQQTLALWQQEVFDQGNVFLTASQVCEQYLVPEGLVGAGDVVNREVMESFWSRHRLTGDNSKERPYAHLYSRLTTRSNTYRVHVIAQSLVKARSTPPDRFDASRDKVVGSRRGSAVLSRQLDLNHPNLPEYQTPVAGTPMPALDRFYRWHIGVLEAE